MIKKQSYCPSLEELKKSFNVSLQAAERVTSRGTHYTIAKIIAASIVVMTLSFIFVPWVQTVDGVGRVIAYAPHERVQKINATTDGRVDRWHVLEGQSVKKGQLLVDISDLDENILERLTLERDAAKLKFETSQHAVETSKKNLDRQKALFEEGLSSARSYELAQIEYNKLVSESSTAAAELARADTRLSRQASQNIVAPVDGFIQKILVPQGGVIVKQGTELAVLVPATNNRSVELFVRGRDLPLLSVGREVRLQFEGWPAVQFSGWPSVAIGTFAGTVSIIDPSDDGHGNFRIIVSPQEGVSWPEPQYLRMGVRVAGWVLLDTVSLGWELWRQFNGFPPSIGSSTALSKNSETSIESVPRGK